MTRKGKFKISVVVPILNEEGNITVLIRRLLLAVKKYSDYELLFVDDGSVDKTLKFIQDQRKKNKKIHYISFSRNFGHQNALRAGLDLASGDCIVSMDGDLQHPPELISELVGKWQEGFDIVNTLRQEDSNVSIFKRKTAALFYYILNKLSDIRVENGFADFRLIDRKVVEVLKTMKEDNLFMRGMIAWLGFKQCGIQYMPESRHWGSTKYTFKKMMKLGMAGITSFSVKPLQLSTMLGYIIASIAFLYGLYAIVMKIFTDTTISGWTSVMVGVLFVGGMQMIMIGIVGEYIGRLFIESKKRPNYVIKEKSL